MQTQFRGWMTPAAVGVISFAAGVGAGYFFKKYRDSAQFDGSVPEMTNDIVLLEEDVNQLRFEFNENIERMNSVVQQANHVIVKFMDSMNEAIKESVNKPEEIKHVESHPAAVKNRSTKKPQAKVKEKVNEVVDIFPVREGEDWDYNEELKTRGPNKPYIIHRDEFHSNETEYRQCSLTYYSGDNILCDESDIPVYNPEKIVGEMIFGHGSGDPSIVYIRNENLEAEYEIVLDEGYYQTEVLGHQVEDGLARNELKHFVQKFRATD